MQVAVTGLSHHTAPVSLRERFALATEDLQDALAVLGAGLGAVAVLSTCNRVEVYTARQTPPTAEEVIGALARVKGAEPPEGGAFYHNTGAEAASHLFRVAAGLDSLVVGESEILGQVRAAFSAATAAGTSNAILARLFHSAIRAGRRARGETGIGAHGLSVSATAVKLSRQALGDLRRKTVAVVGAGDAGRLAGLALAQQGVGRLLVTTRRNERAAGLAAELGAAAFPFAELASVLAEVDIVIACTSAPDFVIGAADVAAAMARRPERPLVMVDIAVPRDVDAAAARVAGVRLFDIDDLQAAAEANRDLRAAEVEAATRIVDEEVARFEAWSRNLGVMPTLAALRRRAEAARQRELRRTLARLPGLSDEERARIEAMTRSLVNRILHAPMERLRRESGNRDVEATRHLFALDEEDEDGT